MSIGKAADSEQTARDAPQANELAFTAGVKAAVRSLVGRTSVVRLPVGLFDESKEVFFYLASDHLISRPESPPAPDEDELTDSDYELIKSRAIALICADLLDSPQAHLDYVNRAVAGALSKDVGT